MLLKEANMKKWEQKLSTAALFAGLSGDRRGVDLPVSSLLRASGGDIEGQG